MIAKNNSNNRIGIVDLLDQGFEMKYVTGPNNRYGVFFKSEGEIDRVKVYDSLTNRVTSDYFLKKEIHPVSFDETDEKAFRELVLMSNQ